MRGWRLGCLLSYRPVQIPNHELLVRRTCHPIRSRGMWVPLDIGDFPRRTVGKEPRRCIQVIEVQYIQPRFGAEDDFLVRRTQTHASHRLVDINDGRCRVLDPGPVRCAMAKSKGQNLDISPHDARFHGAIMRGLYLYFIDGENV